MNESHIASPIVELTPADLMPGRLAETFRAGAVAIILTDDDRVPSLWRTLVERPNRTDPTAEQLPWEDDLFDIARNHRSNVHNIEGHLGDLLRYVPGRIGYIARKIDVWPARNGSGIVSRPERFQRDGVAYQLPHETLESLCGLAAEIWTGLVPDGSMTPGYCIALERLKYTDDVEAFNEIVKLLSDAGGTWARLGYQLDADSELMRRLTEKQLPRQLLAMMCLMPGIGPRLRGYARSVAARSSQYGRIEDGTLIGHPHTDGRYVNCMWGERDAIRTEVLAGGEWLPLDMTRNQLAIVPGRDMERVCGVKPTVHRVIHTNGHASGRKPDWCNVTLVVGLKHPAASMPDAI